MPKKHIFIISTGGTIAMQKTEQGFVAVPNYLQGAMRAIPELHNEDMPSYTVYEYEKPIDSANMNPAHWEQISNLILVNYDKYDGFVVLHGTDTMAYTASALSFMFEHLSKPIILTGSQLPLFETRNDARENLINAMLIAAHYPIPEVCVYFHNKLFRGNRCKKIDASRFAAFTSPNFPALGKVGTDVSIRYSLLQKKSSDPIMLHPMREMQLAVIKIFPGMVLSTLKLILAAPLKAVILETYGLGTAPQSPDFLALLKEAMGRGMIMLNCSQCLTAKVQMATYAASSGLARAGVISGGNMTVEAAITKMIFLFSQSYSEVEIKDKLQENLRGELS